MNKSKILLGTTAMLLAVAGAFATKSHNKQVLRPAATKGCSHFTQATCATQGGTNKCKTVGNSTLRTYSTIPGTNIRTCGKTLVTAPGING